jgi:hypothetical protein
MRVVRSVDDAGNELRIASTLAKVRLKCAPKSEPIIEGGHVGIVRLIPRPLDDRAPSGAARHDEIKKNRGRYAGQTNPPE